MNSNTYNDLSVFDELALRRVGPIGIDETIPDGVIVQDGKPYPAGEAVEAAKRAEERAVYGYKKERSGYTKPGPQTRDKAKAKAARAARKRNRGR